MERVTGPTRVPAGTAPAAVGPTAPSADPLITGLSGIYTLTVTAASACTELPNDLRARVYEAALAHSPYNSNLSAAYFDVFMTGPRFLEGFDSSERFGFLLAGELALFWVGSLKGQPAFVERLSDTSYLAIGGTASAAVAPSARSIAAPMEGYIEYLRDAVANGRAGGRRSLSVRAGTCLGSGAVRIGPTSTDLGPAVGARLTSLAARSTRCRHSGARGRRRCGYRPA